MLERLFGNKNKCCDHSNDSVTHREPPKVTTQQDSMDLLIRKIVPEKYLSRCGGFIGSIKALDKIYYINIYYSHEFHKYRLTIVYDTIYFDNIHSFWKNPYRSIPLSKDGMCCFINEHFIEITDLLQKYVDEQNEKEKRLLEIELNQKICQEKLHQKVVQYCNQKL